ncbi:MAG: S24 family peptidase [Candidatus Latescibacteria bacterium]|nr:S24 family peptidase [Candidatus Latescibacterota bacterium]
MQKALLGQAIGLGAKQHFNRHRRPSRQRIGGDKNRVARTVKFDGRPIRPVDLLRVASQGEIVTADRGEIVVAIIEDEATVKRFYQDPEGVRLEPENETFRPIHVTADSGEFRIAGKVVGLMRRF